MQKITSLIPDEAAMLVFGEKIAHACVDFSCIIYLQGELGAGKTTLVRGFLRGLGYQDKVKSPTYTLVESYSIENQQIFHFDLYRINDPFELEDMGIRDYFAQEAICLIEWPERGQTLLPLPDLHCRIESFNQGRKIVIEANSIKGQTMLKKIEYDNGT